MSDVVDWERMERSGDAGEQFAAWLFVEAVTDANVFEDPVKGAQFYNKDQRERGKFTLEMKINGVEVSPMRVLKRLNEQLDCLVAKHARVLLADKLSDLQDLVETLNQRVRREVHKRLPVLGEEES
jgi:hypothetical protein